MSLGYDRPLFLLPFDHRHSYINAMFHITPPLSSEQQNVVADSKRVIYDGFRKAVAAEVPFAAAGILVDEEFGSSILRDAGRAGYVTALSTETSGAQEFEFEYGGNFADHIEIFQPTFAKALVRYNTEGDAALNRRQTARLRQLSEYCLAEGQKFMFELLVPPTKAQQDRARTSEASYERDMRPALVREAIRALQDAGVEPDIRKIEGIEKRDDCERVVALARREGRNNVGCIVLGSGADDSRVTSWLRVAASVPGFIGFAVGRTTYWSAIADLVAKKISRDDAVSRIARRYSDWASIFEGAQQPAASVA